MVPENMPTAYISEIELELCNDDSICTVKVLGDGFESGP